MKELTFNELTRNNTERCNKHYHKVNKWSPALWCLSMCGEAGEAANKIKKSVRGDKIKKIEIGKEIADVIMYADLLATRLGFKLGDLVRQKFNEVSDRKGSKIKL